MRVVERLPSFEPRHEGAFQGICAGQPCGTAFEILRGSINGQGRQTRWIRKLPARRIHHSILPSDTKRSNATKLHSIVFAPEEKELIIARIEMGLPHAEIAVMFDKPSVASVHMALSRALVRLAEEMAHERKR